MNSDQSLEIPGKKMRPFDIKDFVLRRSLLVLALGLGIFICLSPIALILRKPYYQTGGTILLSPEVNLLAPRDVRRVPGSFREFATTHATRLKSKMVVRKALEALPREDWPSTIPPEMPLDLASTIMSHKFGVDIVGGSQLLHIGLVGDTPEGIDDAVNSLIETYVSQLEEEQERDSKRRLVYLTEEKDVVTAQINALKEQRAKLAVELKSNSFNELRNPAYDRLIDAQNSFLRASATALEKKSFLEKAERDQEILGAVDLSVFAREMVETNEAVYMIDNWTYQKLQDLRAGIDGLTEENSDRIGVEERMKAMTDYLATFKSQMHETMLDIITEKRDFELDAEKTKAESAFIAAKEYAEKLGEEMKNAQTAFTASSESLVDGLEISDEIDDLKERLSFLDTRISEVNLDAKAPIFLSVEELAREPGAPAGDNFITLLGMIFAASMGLVGVSTLGFELLDGRVRAPGDVRSALGGIPLLPVPMYFGEGGADGFRTCVKSNPSHPCAKAIRSSVVRLNIEREQNDSSIFLFTGASPKSGVSSLVENFAAGFAHYVDQVLIISFEDDGEILPEGKADQIASDSIVDATLAQFPENESWIGKIALTNESKLLRRRSNISRLLDEASERFGIVVIDARPLSGSDLTQFLAAKADTVVLTAKRGMSQYSALRKDVELLFRMGVPGLSAIFNAAIEQPMDQVLSWKTRAVETYIPQLRAVVEKRIWKLVGRMPLMAFGKQEDDDSSDRRGRANSVEAGVDSSGVRKGADVSVSTGKDTGDSDVILPG